MNRWFSGLATLSQVNAAGSAGCVLGLATPSKARTTESFRLLRKCGSCEQRFAPAANDRNVRRLPLTFSTRAPAYWSPSATFRRHAAWKALSQVQQSARPEAASRPLVRHSPWPLLRLGAGTDTSQPSSGGHAMPDPLVVSVTEGGKSTLVKPESVRECQMKDERDGRLPALCSKWCTLERTPLGLQGYVEKRLPKNFS
jgi:hypothetical protein